MTSRIHRFTKSKRKKNITSNFFFPHPPTIGRHLPQIDNNNSLLTYDASATTASVMVTKIIIITVVRNNDALLLQIYDIR